MATPERVEKPVLLRIPEFYLMVLDGIVKNSKGKFKSRNDLVIEILRSFVVDLNNQASLGKKKGQGKKNG
jgi:hypothetical protein